MADKTFPQSGLPIRRTVELLPKIFQTATNDKFLSGVLDPLVQPGVLQKQVGYIGRRYGKTYKGSDIYLNSDETLRSRYQLEPGVVYKNDQGTVESFYDYLDFKNQLNFFGNTDERDDQITSQEHYSWNPPLDWDKFVNYREYYWEPSGPPSVSVKGQAVGISSTYKVRLGVNSFIFTPDGYTNNPNLTLYRGQTYKFIINAPTEGFVIRTNYDVGTLTYNRNYPYSKNQITISNGKVWRALEDIAALGGPVAITESSTQFEYVSVVSTSTALDYNTGVTNNRTENGVLTFTVPYDAPDVLFYQSVIDPNKFGQFVIANAESNTKIDIESEIIGKTNYKSSNGVEFTNGLVVSFEGLVLPEQYASGTWLVEGVGTSITLTRFTDLIVPTISNTTPEVLFDEGGFDTEPFDDASQYPGQKDYITISRNSNDSNPWSRYNRWFHRSVLEYAYSSRGQDFSAAETARAKRPIIEFKANLQLFNHGKVAKKVVDYIDTTTTDVFSKIEGSLGYNIDGEFVFEGARILVTADTDSLANNKIYEVTFILHNGRTQVHLKQVDDSDSVEGECVLIRRGNNFAGLMFHFDGEAWVRSQEKTSVNQAPLFDAYDEGGNSFSDTTLYPVSTFAGTKILGYKVGTSVADSELGFSLSYLNIDNIGDIQFEWLWDTDTFYYTQGQVVYSKDIATGYYKFNPDDTYDNGWIKTDLTYIQPVIDSAVITESTNSVSLDPIDWSSVSVDTAIEMNFYVNGIKLNDTWTRVKNTFTFDNTTFSVSDVVSIKVISSIPPNLGYYEIPVGLEKNPLNQNLTTFTLGQAIDHITTAVEFKPGFTGILPGASNLRDITDYEKYAKRFLKHSGITPLAVSLLSDKTTNIIKAIQYNKKSYTDFKNNFLAKALELPYEENIPKFVDLIISELTKTKNESSPFADSDMIGAGAYTPIVYNVDDTGIKTFSLSTKFTLTELSKKAVYVYLNESQLLHGKDYEFNETFGFVTLLINLAENDVVEIREYVSTAFNHIPPTPTSMGLYKKYTPMIFSDDTYVEPKDVIQGHDGSITIAYGDYRDDLLLELEYRIYNNIKKEYNRDIFDIDKIVGGFYGTGAIYDRSQLDAIVVQEFLKWIQNTNINYTQNEYFDRQNSFTYTYSNMSDPSNTINLLGWWRGVYQWFYDTDRPHRCPWEMLGFSEQPAWWEDEYGPAPYTKNNLLLWEDLRDGIIRQGDREGTYDRYKRPTLMQHIPADADGNLLSPLDAGLAQNFSLIRNDGPFVLGDVSPVEYAWRSSSEWPFAVTMAMCLMKPLEFITDMFDLSQTKINKIGQTVNATTNKFRQLTEIVLPTASDAPAVGLVKFLTSYLKFRGLDLQDPETKLKNLSVNLSSRLSGFADKEQQRYLLDSKSPKASSSSIFVPPENYDLIFNVSSPIASLSYSGVIIEKAEGGWVITGYDDIHPYFEYLEPQRSQGDPTMSVGGVSESFTDWSADKGYNNGQVVRYRNDFYRALKTHNSQIGFDLSFWKKLPDIPVVGGVTAQRRRTFNTLNVQRLVYGSKLTSIQAVVDFLLGYEARLIAQGFKFDQYDAELQSPQNWTTSCKEFMFWTVHNWAVGSLITLSPAAEHIEVTLPVGVADSLLDGFYEYQVLKSDGKILTPNYINVNRSFQRISVETTNTTDGIYYIKLYFVLKEHVVLFSDKTVFNDVIYDKTTGYRQERIKTQGFLTVDWDGDYTSPGFMFDNVDIQQWKPFTDYKSGDIVSYRSYNWTSLSNQIGVETFDDTTWSKLDLTPEKQLVANFDYKINQFEDYYDVSSDGLGNSQRTLARHAIGYQTRDYLQNMAEDPVTQFQLYQGFIKEKGTANAITKVFNKLSSATSDSVILKEEWAFRIGQFGGTDQLVENEFTLYKNKFEINPQPIIITETEPVNDLDQYYRVKKLDFTIDPSRYNLDITPTTNDSLLKRIAGYVKTDTVDFIVKNRDDILLLDVYQFKENDHIWVTFDKAEWTVLRYNESPVLIIAGIQKVEDLVTITFNRFHDCQVGDIVGIKNIPNLTGFFKISEVGIKSITVSVDATAQNPEWEDSTIVNLNLFTEARFGSYEELDPKKAALLGVGSKLWIDDNLTSGWEVVEKTKQFTAKELVDSGIAEPMHLGSKVVYNEKNKQSIVSIPYSGYVMVYLEVPTGLGVTQILLPQESIKTNVAGSFGKTMAVSTDGKWLIVGSPDASNITSYYVGAFDPVEDYVSNDIVSHDGRLWRAVDNLTSPTVPGVDSDDWELATSIPIASSGQIDGYTRQGVITIYNWTGQRWQTYNSFVSPLPVADELFGSEITIGQVGTTYYAAIAAKGALNNKGKVYMFTCVNDEWEHLVVDNKEFSLPQSIALGVDGSSLGYDVELIKDGDEFGYSMTMNQDGSVLVVGTPKSDGQYFENYKGWWKSTVAYQPDDVVRFENNYYRLDDSTVGEVGLEPHSFPWTSVGDSTTQSAGKVFVYKKDAFNKYNLIQTIDAGSLVLIDDTPSIVDTYATATTSADNTITVKNTTGMVINMPIMFTGTSFGGLTSGTTYYIKEITRVGVNGAIKVSRKFGGLVYSLVSASGNMTITAGGTPDVNVGDEFGYSLSLDYSGEHLVISSPQSDINFQNQGSAYVFKTSSTDTIEYRLKQKIESFERFPNEYFGQSVSISPSGNRVAIGAKNTPFKVTARLDVSKGTTFDQGKTRFVERNGYAGAVYIFERKNNQFFLVEKLEAELSPFESFGFTLDCTDSAVLVGSPDFRAPDTVDGIEVFAGAMIGTVRLFTKDETINSWELLSAQEQVTDIRRVQSISLYDVENNIKIQDLDYVDSAKLKILNAAEKEIKFKTLYDPATYTLGTDEVSIDSDTAWSEKHVGELWWDISSVKWKYYEQHDISYRTSNWNTLAVGASINVYEWVETVLLPSEWAALADTNEGLAEGISGQPLYPNDNVYSVKQFYSPATGLLSGSRYYYWVKNKTIIPENLPGRSLSAASVSSYISNPAGTGIAFVALIDSDKFLAYNFNSIINTDSVSLNIEYKNNNVPLNAIHREYALMTEDDENSFVPTKLEEKWIDSLSGSNASGNPVPDPSLPAKQKYGISFRPRQGMFEDRIPILKTTIQNVNTILEKEAFADLINFETLNLVDQPPSYLLNLYDIAVDNEVDLVAVGTVRLKTAELQANLIDGEIDTIDIIDAGFGYRAIPSITIYGDGQGAKAEVTLDNQGRISSVNIINKGKKYSSVTIAVREFSVLVKNDTTVNNFWSIYSWDDERQVFFRSKTQAYDTTKYWNYADWWSAGYTENSRIIAEIQTIFAEPSLVTEVDDLIRVKEYGAGGWAVFKKISDSAIEFSERFVLVGRENGTIQLSETLWNTKVTGIGYDNTQAYDIKLYDIENALELRNILKAVKEDIFVGDYAAEWNKLFFTGVRYAFHEQPYIDWAFKTSFLNATHNVGELTEKLNYKNDNLDSYREYINEVKPYRTTIREYISRYEKQDTSGSAVSDFDLPPRYSIVDGHAIPVKMTDETIQTYPWKWWVDNSGYSLVSIELSNAGSGYEQAPNVVISGGGGSGALAKAYISNGIVSGIQVINSGTGFTSAPTITLVGGNGSSTDVATAVAIIGDTKARTFNLGIKFDRFTKDGLYQEFVVDKEPFTANGYSAVYDLKYAPTRDKSKIKILKNNQLVLNNEYSITLYISSTDEYSLLKGKVIFVEVPAAGDEIVVTYEKNDQLLDAVSRINKYYTPSAGMKGKDTNQLMTGIDYGGVQVQGTTFDVTGGWDALPWFTDNWDSVESSSDYYVRCDGSTTSVTLPFVPSVGQEINVYIKRAGTGLLKSNDTLYTLEDSAEPIVGYEATVKEQPTIRIDDPFFTDQVDSSTSVNPNAQMPTFVGDGITDTIIIGTYIETYEGDTLIFRTAESDGSVTITDDNLLDTKLSGGDFAYITANGLNAEDISIDGGKFITPDQVPAPEENIPGQVLDSVSIKVFTTDTNGSAPLQTKVLYGDGNTRLYDIGLRIFETTSLMVYVDKVKQYYSTDALTEYEIDFVNNQIIFVTAPVDGAVIEIISIGRAGVALLDYQEFIADGNTSLFLTNAAFSNTSFVSVTVNGSYVDTGFINSTGVVDTEEKSLIRFGTAPLLNSVIKIVALGGAETTGIIRVYQQEFEFEGSTKSFELANHVIQTTGSAESSMIVEVNGTILRGVDTTYTTYDGSNNTITIGVDPEEGPGAVLSTNLRVYINNELKTFVTDYIFDSATKEVIITATMVVGDNIKIENDFRSEYFVTSDSTVSILTIGDNVTLSSTNETNNDKIKVTWFSEYPSMSMVADEFTGGKINYKLGFIPLGVEYVWVYKNGERLVQDIDYTISLPRGVVYLTNNSTTSDIVKVISFGSKVYHDPCGYEIYKDMLNVYHYKRYSKDEVKLAQSLTYYDQQIVVTDASNLGTPNRDSNIPGTVLINNERIEYLQKNGNVLSQLRRGVQGTAIAELHNNGSYVIDVGVTETIPYKETQDKQDFVSDGSTTLIGPLSYVPVVRTDAAGNAVEFDFKDTIPDGYYPCDQFEVFAGGQRLRKDPINVYVESLGAASQAVNEQIDAEFAVDGTTPYIKLTEKVPAGTRISIIRKVGTVWHNKGTGTASSGVTLLENTTPIANFIAKKSTILPE